MFGKCGFALLWSPFLCPSSDHRVTSFRDLVHAQEEEEEEEEGQRFVTGRMPGLFDLVEKGGESVGMERAAFVSGNVFMLRLP